MILTDIGDYSNNTWNFLWYFFRLLFIYILTIMIKNIFNALNCKKKVYYGTIF